MLETRSLISLAVFLATFLVISGLGIYLLLLLDRDRRRGAERLRDLKGGRPSGSNSRGSLWQTLLTRVGAVLLPPAGEVRAQLQKRLTRAGLYRSSNLRTFLGVQVMLGCGLPALAAGLPMLLGWIEPSVALTVAGVAAAVGVLGPAWWLNTRAANRQASLRGALPDALDILVLCLEGGVSMQAALQRVTGEMQATHAALGGEMNIMLREMQMGLSAGDAMKKFGDRCELEEVHNLATVLLQSERFGAGVVKALRIHADTSRQERQQRAEEVAQKAAVKIIFPTLLCIFPAIFIVILGPAAYQIAGMMSQMK